MIGAIYDDAIHIGQACKWIQVHPDFRPFVYGLTCGLGESITGTRIASAAFILLSIWLVNVLLGGRGGWVMLFHPLLWFPFFYASQISTALSVFAALTFVYFLLQIIEKERYELGIPLMLAATVMIGSRIESFVYAWIILLAVGLKRRIEGKRFDFSYLWGSGLVTFSTFTYYLHTHPERFGPLKELYPLELWPVATAEAVTSYVAMFAFPFAAPFFGQWTLGFSEEYLSIWIILTALVSYYLMATSQKLMPSWNILGASGFLLIFSSLVLSFVPRVDWYFLGRAYLGTLLALPFLISLLPRWGKARAFLFSYFLLGFLYTFYFQYRDTDTFLAHELKASNSKHPAVLLLNGNRRLEKGQPEMAYYNYRSAYNLVKSLPESVVVRNYQVKALTGMEIAKGEMK